MVKYEKTSVFNLIHGWSLVMTAACAVFAQLHKYSHKVITAYLPVMKFTVEGPS